MTDDTIAVPAGELRIAVATVEQAPALREIRNTLARWMRQRGIVQWRPGEMSLEWIEMCISWGAVYVVTREEQIVGSVTVVRDDPFIWGEQPADAGYMHMLMVAPQFRGHRIGQSILAWAEALIRDADRPLARLDCVESNTRLRSYYEAVGYRFVGHKTFPELGLSGETALYEKSLTPGA
jgi:protein-tyrosine phosphatase